MKNYKESLVARVFDSYASAARSAAGAGMLMVAILLSLWVWVEQGIPRASFAFSLLYFFLLTTLAADRWKRRGN